MDLDIRKLSLEARSPSTNCVRVRGRKKTCHAELSAGVVVHFCAPFSRRRGTILCEKYVIDAEESERRAKWFSSRECIWAVSNHTTQPAAPLWPSRSQFYSRSLFSLTHSLRPPHLCSNVCVYYYIRTGLQFNTTRINYRARARAHTQTHIQ